jgi:hypothetical protein
VTALADLKSQLNIIDDADDTLLAGKLAAAVAFTKNEIGSEDPLAYDDAPADLQQAILLLAAHWYENREASVIGLTAIDLPLGYRDILQSHRVWVC